MFPFSQWLYWYFVPEERVMRHLLKCVHHDCLLDFLPSHWHHIIRLKFFSFLLFIMENSEQIQKQQNRIMSHSSAYPSPSKFTHFHTFICLLLFCIILKQMSDKSFHMAHLSDICLKYHSSINLLVYIFKKIGLLLAYS